MFKKNLAAKQLNIDDPIFSFPGYVQEMLKNSWAEYFFHNIFSKINEERFNCLYSSNYSRPNAPVNMLVGLLILKELNRSNDEELIASLYFDYRVKGKKSYVGYTTNLVEARDREKGLSMIVHYEKQPNIMSDAEFGLNSIKELQGISYPGQRRCLLRTLYSQQKRYFMVSITEKQYIADTCRSLLGIEQYRALADFRAGVEGVPSVLRRVYGVDALPVRGLIRSRIWDHGKMMAYNFKSFFHYCRKNGVSAPSCSFILIAFQRFIRYFRLNGVTDLRYA